jgi:hypothetical protein
MLANLPKTTERVSPTTLRSMATNFYQHRKTLVRKTDHPRILKIGLHTLRHWKAIMEYRKNEGHSPHYADSRVQTSATTRFMPPSSTSKTKTTQRK